MISHPFVEGVKAYDKYESRSDNPYPESSIEAFAWDRGYSERKHGYVDEYGWYREEDEPSY